MAHRVEAVGPGPVVQRVPSPKHRDRWSPCSAGRMYGRPLHVLVSARRASDEWLQDAYVLFVGMPSTFLCLPPCRA